MPTGKWGHTRLVVKVANNSLVFSEKAGAGCYWTLKKLHKGCPVLVVKTGKLVPAKKAWAVCQDARSVDINTCTPDAMYPPMENWRWTPS